MPQWAARPRPYKAGSSAAARAGSRGNPHHRLEAQGKQCRQQQSNPGASRRSAASVLTANRKTRTHSVRSMITASALVGTWKLKSYVVVTATGLRSTPLGENPRGYLTYTPEGRMQVIGAAHE